MLNLEKLRGLELEVDAPGRVMLLRPGSNQPLVDADGKQAYIDIYSSDSAIAMQYKRDLKTERLSHRTRTVLTGEKADEEVADFLAALTTGWHLVSLAGEVIDLEFSREAAKAVYANHRMLWVLDQVDTFAADRENFLKASSAS